MFKRIFIMNFLLALGLCAFAGCNKAVSDNNSENDITYARISQQEAKRLMDTEEDYVILDVRTQAEYDEKHIPNAVLIPDYEIEEKAESVIPDKDTLILVYCRSGRRSKAASQKLAEMGYTNVKEFGGINDWEYETE